MKPRVLLPILALLAFATALNASAAEDSGEAPAQIAMQELSTRLNLTAEQQASIAPALEERNNRLKALRGEMESGGSRRQKIKTLREARSIQQDFVGKVSPLLTKEQQTEWAKIREESRDKLKERAQSRQ